MIWQSNVIAVVQFVFGVALLPTILNRQAQVPRRTSVTTAIGLWVIAGTYVTMGLWTAVLAGGSCALAWTFVALWRPVRTMRFSMNEKYLEEGATE